MSLAESALIGHAQNLLHENSAPGCREALIVRGGPVEGFDV